MNVKLSELTTNRNNNFNLIRFIAAFLVLYSHSFAIATGDTLLEPLRDSLGMSWGTIAVDVFFVTSGFLICASFFNRREILAFAWARILRIFPALIVAIFFCVFVIGSWFTTLSLPEYLTSLGTYKFLVQNVVLLLGIEYKLPGVFESNPFQYAVNGSLWTLPYELKMYILLALVLTVLATLEKRFRFSIRFILVGIGCLALLLNIYDHFDSLTDSHFLRLFTMFFVGAAYYLNRNVIVMNTKLFLICLVVLGLSAFNQSSFLIVYLMTLPYVILFLAYCPSGKLLEFNKIGDYSYGLYVYAFPVQQALVAIKPGIGIYEMIYYTTAITFLLAFLSWHIVEKQALKLKNGYKFFLGRFRQ